MNTPLKVLLLPAAMPAPSTSAWLPRARLPAPASAARDWSAPSCRLAPLSSVNALLLGRLPVLVVARLPALTWVAPL